MGQAGLLAAFTAVELMALSVGIAITLFLYARCRGESKTTCNQVLLVGVAGNVCLCVLFFMVDLAKFSRGAL